MLALREVVAKGALELKKSSVDAVLLSDVGAFGLNMSVIGVGMLALSSHHEAGADLVKLGAVLMGAGYGVYTLATGELPKLTSRTGDLDARWAPVLDWAPKVGLGFSLGVGAAEVSHALAKR